VGEREWFETKKKCLIRELGVVLLEDAAGVRVGVGHGDHRVGLCSYTDPCVSKGSMPS